VAPLLGARAQLVGELSPLLDRDEGALRTRAGEGERVPAVTGPDLELQGVGAGAEPGAPVGQEIEGDRRVVLRGEDHEGASLAW
jgi:hypothetical protein